MNGAIHKRAFTLIELLVVIGIIGVLSAVVLTSLQNSRERAIATQIAAELRSMNQAFRIDAIDRNSRSDYPLESSYGISGQNPWIQSIINAGYLESLTDMSDSRIGDGRYRYDNDGDQYISASCGSSSPSFSGVSIIIFGVTDPNELGVVNEIDEILDGGDGLGCGNVRYRTSNGLFGYILDDNA